MSEDRPTSLELDRLLTLTEATPIDRVALASHLDSIHEGLGQRREDLKRAGGLLEDEDHASRMSLAREDDRLCQELTALAADVQWFRQEVEAGDEDRQLRLRASAVLAGLRGHRDAEASLILESSSTEVGSGD